MPKNRNNKANKKEYFTSASNENTVEGAEELVSND
jgi:hypothetical protein